MKNVEKNVPEEVFLTRNICLINISQYDYKKIILFYSMHIIKLRVSANIDDLTESNDYMYMNWLNTF